MWESLESSCSDLAYEVAASWKRSVRKAEGFGYIALTRGGSRGAAACSR